MSDLFTLPPENVTPGQLFMLLQSLDAKQALIADELGDITARITALEADTADMRQAWKTAGMVLFVLKWAAAVGAGAVAVISYLRSNFQ